MAASFDQCYRRVDFKTKAVVTTVTTSVESPGVPAMHIYDRWIVYSSFCTKIPSMGWGLYEIRQDHRVRNWPSDLTPKPVHDHVSPQFR